MKKLILLLALLTQFGLVQAQLSLAPTAVYLDQNGIGNLFVTNSSPVPQEITINFQFGYSDQDENGVLVMQYNDTTNARLFGLDSYVKAFPRTFILPPNQQQIVRLQARMPKTFADGTYFTRIKVGSSSQVADIGTADATTGISTKVNLKFEQVIVAFYKKGNVNTGLRIDRAEAKIDTGAVLTLDSWYTITGNSPFLGRVDITIKDPSGKVVGEGKQLMAMYFTGKRRFKFNIKEVQSGRYSAEYRFVTSRQDIPDEDLVQAQPYTYKTNFTLK